MQPVVDMGVHCMILVVCTFTLLITGQTIIEGPRNTAVNFAQDTTLHCKANLGSDVLEWRRYWNDTFELIWNSQDDDITDERFTVDVDSQSGTYNLNILNAEPDLGGLYLAQLVNSKDKREAQVVVLSGLGCIPETTYPTQEGADILIQCATSYYGYKAPFMQVYDGDKLLSSQDIVTEDHKNTYASFPATPEHNATNYRCEMSFKPDENDTLPPVKQDQCNTGIFIVYYGVHNVDIEPKVRDVKIGDQFTCSADSYPAPEFKWYCQDRMFLRTGNILTVEEELLGEQLCICNAYTKIFGQDRQSEANITFVASTDDEDGNSGANIPVAAIATVMSLVGVACASVCVFILIKTKRLHDNNQEKMRNLSHE